MFEYKRMGVAAAAALLDMWLEGDIQLTHAEYDALCAKLVELLGDSRDEIWRLQGKRTVERVVRDTIPDTEFED